MSVSFNYIEDLGNKCFLLKHLKQEFLYLLIEYDQTKPTFFISAPQYSEFKEKDQKLQLKRIVNYDPPSETLYRLSAIPWSAYVLTTQRHGHCYHFIYEVSDPQRQQPESQLILEALTEKNRQKFLNCRLYPAYENIFCENIFFGKTETPSIGTLTLLPSHKVIKPNEEHTFYIPIQLNESFSFSLDIKATEYCLFTDHLESQLISITPKNKYRVQLDKTLTATLDQKSGSQTIHAGILKNRKALRLDIINQQDKNVSNYTLLIRTDTPQEKIWDSKKPLPFSKIKSVTWDNMANIIKSNLLSAYHGDYDTFWGITKDSDAPLFYISKTEGIYRLPLNFYYAVILHKYNWAEKPFQNYIQASLSLLDPKYYLYEDDPRYREYFHLYYLGKFSSEKLISILKDRIDEIRLKPLSIWSSIDAFDCLNYFYIAEKENNETYFNLARTFLDIFQKRLTTNPAATALHSKIVSTNEHSKPNSKVEIISPQGVAIVALLKGFELFKDQALKHLSLKQLEYLLQNFPIKKQKFIEKKHDTSALIHTMQALKKATAIFPKFESDLNDAKKRIIELFQRDISYLPLSTQIEILDLLTKIFYCYS